MKKLTFAIVTALSITACSEEPIDDAPVQTVPVETPLDNETLAPELEIEEHVAHADGATVEPHAE